MTYIFVRQPCDPYPRPSLADVEAAPIGDRSVDRRAHWLLGIVTRLGRDDLEQLTMALAAVDQRTFEQVLQGLPKIKLPFGNR